MSNKAPYKWLTNSDTLTAVASGLGMSSSTLSRQLNHQVLPLKTIIKLAQIYKKPLHETLLRFGYITPEYVEETEQKTLADYTTDELLQELRNRIKNQ